MSKLDEFVAYVKSLTVGGSGDALARDPRNNSIADVIRGQRQQLASSDSDGSGGGSGGTPPGAPGNPSEPPKAPTPASNAGNKTDVGRAKTQPAPAPPKQPTPSPKQPAAGHGTAADSQPPLKPQKPGEMTKSQIDAENKAHRERFPTGYKTPPLPTQPGDGEVVSIRQAFDELGKKNGVVKPSGSHAWHRDLWQRAGKTGEPPVAFKFAGKIQVDIEKLPKDQRETWIKLDKAQDAALGGKNYPHEEPPSKPKTPPSEPPSKPKTPTSEPPSKAKPPTPEPHSGPKTTSKAGGHVEPPVKSTPVKTPEIQFAEVAPKVGKLKNLGSKFANGIKVVGAAAVKVLEIVGPILQALDAIEHVDSALAGNGFIFTQQVNQCRNLAAQAQELVKSYREAGYHADLDKMIDLAKEIDKQNPEGLYGSDALSTFCASVRSDVVQYESKSKDLQDEMTSISNRANTGREALEKLLDNPAVLAAADLTGDDATMFMAWQDFRKIIDILAGPTWLVSQHHTQVEGDLKRIKDHVLDDQPGWLTDE